MTKSKFLPLTLTVFILVFLSYNASSCSMYKVTVNNKTTVGTNFDAYYLTPRIWFENGKDTESLGAVLQEEDLNGSNGFAPQSGMNEYGLAFSRLAAPPPQMEKPVTAGKRTITNPTNYLKDILHTCKTVDE